MQGFYACDIVSWTKVAAALGGLNTPLDPFDIYGKLGLTPPNSSCAPKTFNGQFCLGGPKTMQFLG